MSNRCLSCNKILSRFERARKYETTEVEIGLCNPCFSTIEEQLREAEKVSKVKEHEFIRASIPSNEK